MLYDDQAASTRAYQAPATSFVVIVNRAGKVTYTGVGADQQFEDALKAASATYGDKVEFVAVNVTVNQTPERVRRYMESHQIPFRVLYDDQAASTRAYQAPATSFIVIVDRAGKVVYTGVGADQPFENALEGLKD